jgi:hypothetical protein
MSSMTPSYAGVVAMGASSRPPAPGTTTTGRQPTPPDWETYEIPSTEDRPEFDESKVKSLTQEHAASGIRTLREAYQMAAARLPSSPQTRLTLRSALKGYGTGLENVMGGARKTARAEETQKFGVESAVYQQEYAARLVQAQQQADWENRRLMLQYQADYTEYLGDPDQNQIPQYLLNPGYIPTSHLY